MIRGRLEPIVTEESREVSVVFLDSRDQIPLIKELVLHGAPSRAFDRRELVVES